MAKIYGIDRILFPRPPRKSRVAIGTAALRTMEIPCILCDVIVIRKNGGARTKTSESTDGFDSVRRMDADRMSQTALRIRGMLNNAYQVERPKSTMEQSVENVGRTAVLLLTAFTHRVPVTMLNYF